MTLKDKKRTRNRLEEVIGAQMRHLLYSDDLTTLGRVKKARQEKLLYMWRKGESSFVLSAMRQFGVDVSSFSDLTSSERDEFVYVFVFCLRRLHIILERAICEGRDVYLECSQTGSKDWFRVYRITNGMRLQLEVGKPAREPHWYTTDVLVIEEPERR